MGDFDTIAEGLRRAVPFVRTLGLEFTELSAERAVLRLPDNPAVHNHIGGPHAGALFTLGESATGAIVLAGFSDLLDAYTPLAHGARIRYRAPAHGPVTATAVPATPTETIRGTLDAEGKARFDVDVVFHDSRGTLTGEMTVTWALHPAG